MPSIRARDSEPFSENNLRVSVKHVLSASSRPADALAALDAAPERIRRRLVALLRRAARYDIDFASSRKHAAALGCSYRTVLRDVALLSELGLLVVTARAETSQERVVPEAVRYALTRVGPDGRPTRSRRLNASRPPNLTQHVPKGLRETESPIPTSSNPVYDSKSLSSQAEENEKGKKAAQRLTDEGGIRVAAKALALVAEHGPELVERVLDLRRAEYTAPHVIDRGRYVMRLLRDEATESRRARDAERPPQRGVAAQPELAHRDPAAIARRAAERAETDEERDRRRETEAAQLQAAAIAKAEREAPYLDLSDSDREELHEIARAQLTPIQQHHEPSIRMRAITLMLEGWTPPATSPDSYRSRRTQNTAKGPQINGLRAVSETMSAWSFG